MSPSAAGSSARGIIAWTVLAPLALALLALAGERQGFYNLHFAFALLAAAMCCGLTAAGAVERRARRTRAAARARARATPCNSPPIACGWRSRPPASRCGSGCRRRVSGSRSTAPSGSIPPPTSISKPGWRAPCATARPSSNSRCAVPAAMSFPARNAGCSPPAGASSASGRAIDRSSSASPSTSPNASSRRSRSRPARRACSSRRAPCPASSTTGTAPAARCCAPRASSSCSATSGAEISPVSRWWEDLVHPDDRALARPARVARAAGADNDAESISCEYRVRHKNGNYVWIWDHCVLVRDRSGAITRVVGSVLDITERKEAEARLATSEHRFKAALLATTGIFWTFSRDGRAVGEQTSWSAFTGQSSDELAGLGWLDAIHPEDAASTLDAWRRALATHDEMITVHRVRRRDGEYRTFSVHAVPVADERGEIIEWVGSHTDITEQREAEAARARQPAAPGAGARRGQRRHVGLGPRLRPHDLDAPDPPDHRRRGAGFRRARRGILRALLPPDIDHAEICRRDARRPDALPQSELQIRRPDGTLRWIQNRATAICDAAGRTRRIVGTLRDVTRRKELEAEREALLTAERAARSDLVRGLAGQGRIPRHHLARTAHAAQCHPRLDHAAAAAARRRRRHRRWTEGHRTQCARADAVARRPARCQPAHVGQAVADLRTHGPQ